MSPEWFIRTVHCGDGGRSAPRPPRRWSIRTPSPQTVVDLPRTPPDGGRSADVSSASRVGGSTTLWVITWTVVDLGTICPHRRWLNGHRLAGQPNGGRCATTTRRRNVGRSATVWWSPGQIDHRLGGLSADRPSQGRPECGLTIVLVGPDADRPLSGRAWGGSTTVIETPVGHRHGNTGRASSSKHRSAIVIETPVGHRHGNTGRPSSWKHRSGIVMETPVGHRHRNTRRPPRRCDSARRRLAEELRLLRSRGESRPK